MKTIRKVQSDEEARAIDRGHITWDRLSGRWRGVRRYYDRVDLCVHGHHTAHAALLCTQRREAAALRLAVEDRQEAGLPHG